MSGKTLRLVYPQFQGGWPQNIANCLNNQFSVEDATFGYWLGSQIMNIIAPKVDGPTCEVPINTDQSAEALKDEKTAQKIILRAIKYESKRTFDSIVKLAPEEFANAVKNLSDEGEPLSCKLFYSMEKSPWVDKTIEKYASKD